MDIHIKMVALSTTRMLDMLVLESGRHLRLSEVMPEY